MEPQQLLPPFRACGGEEALQLFRFSLLGDSPSCESRRVSKVPNLPKLKLQIALLFVVALYSFYIILVYKDSFSVSFL